MIQMQRMNQQGLVDSLALTLEQSLVVLTRTKLLDIGSRITRIERVVINLVAVCGNYKDGSHVGNLSALASDIKRNDLVVFVVLDINVVDRDIRVLEASTES